MSYRSLLDRRAAPVAKPKYPAAFPLGRALWDKVARHSALLQFWLPFIPLKFPRTAWGGYPLRPIPSR